MAGGQPRYAGPDTPAVMALRRVARALGPLVERVVFIGGAVAPLLQTEPVLASVRPTDDVDGVAASASYTEYNALQDALRQLGFKDHGMAGSGPRVHAHRWLVPGGGVFDLVPAGAHLGGTGSAWDAYALASAEALDLGSDAAGPLVVRHASAAAFLALKWAAYADRGQDDPLTSHDLEDVLALVASRPSLGGEVAAAPAAVRTFVADSTRGFLALPDPGEIVYAQLRTFATTSVSIREQVLARLAWLAAAPEPDG